MKLTSYQIREAIKEGRHIDAATILAQHYGYVIDPPESEIKVTRVPHTRYAIRIWLHHRVFEWEDGDLYSTYGTGGNGPLISMVIWTPNENR